MITPSLMIIGATRTKLGWGGGGGSCTPPMTDGSKSPCQTKLKTQFFVSLLVTRGNPLFLLVTRE